MLLHNTILGGLPGTAADCKHSCLGQAGRAEGTLAAVALHCEGLKACCRVRKIGHSLQFGGAGQQIEESESRGGDSVLDTLDVN